MDAIIAIAEVIGENPVPPIIVAVVVGVPSLLLYVVEVIVLLSPSGWKKFSSTFFRLFLTRALVNIAHYLSTYVWRFGLLGIFLPFFVFIGNFGLAMFWFFG